MDYLKVLKQNGHIAKPRRQSTYKGGADHPDGAAHARKSITLESRGPNRAKPLAYKQWRKEFWAKRCSAGQEKLKAMFGGRP